MSLNDLFPATIAAVILLAIPSLGMAFEEPLDLGFRKQLLVDDGVISEVVRVRRELGRTEKANQGKPLAFSYKSDNGQRRALDVWPLFASVYYDAQRKRFRMWHRVSFDDRSRRQNEKVTTQEIGVGVKYHRGYSESEDGLDYELVGLLSGLSSGGDTNLVVTIDDSETDPKHRYKIGYDCDCEVNGAALAHSADGIHWIAYNGGKPVTYRAADFTNQVIWDPVVKAHRLFTRTDFGWGGGPLAGAVDVKVGDKPLEIRGVRSMLNPHLKTHPTDWKLEHHWLLDGEPRLSRNRPPMRERLKNPKYLERVRNEAQRRQIYVMTDWIYEGVHFGLLSVLEYPADVSEGVKTDHFTRHERSVENYYIATSRDGVEWDFQWIYAGQPLVPRGPNGAWDKDMIFPTTQIITQLDKHWIYYGGNNERHGAAEKGVWFARQGGIGLAWLRLDGFVSLAADARGGTVTTKPFKLNGTRLLLNVNAGGNGSVRVEFLDRNSRPIHGFSGKRSRSYRGIDELRFAPGWLNQSDLSPIKGRIVRLRFHLNNARLYAFQIQP